MKLSIRLAPSTTTTTTTIAATTKPTNISALIPPHLTQPLVDASPFLKRLQQDLLILTSFPDNASLHWRPTWFPPSPTPTSTPWTLHNPPNVTTLRLPNTPHVPHAHTRAMRSPSSSSSSPPPQQYIKTWRHWTRYCALYAIPTDFLSPAMIALIQLAQQQGATEPPTWPLYPEPLPETPYVLPSASGKSLARKFERVDEGWCVVVRPSGALEVVEREGSIEGVRGVRWSHVPWSREQEESCRGFRLRLRFWNCWVLGDDGVGGKGRKREREEEGDGEERRVKMRVVSPGRGEGKMSPLVDEGYDS
ncbi:hypothetical protein BU24DRAFT_471279 [Aaosphaeria arxii CBS 175.79]|uniref:Uncharacterized protein n=1 Tax=Aaosphaeria arxii CBS 175.79 TaxID=1450172 RepID=A0A6A5YC06_9PLEO|nr:uncharacterized protein BU24DRAFT_471279 [Aaosphaeria arxii CBS 175.79]KAF2022164.1 hypothetical protein BU24DRAFT_471279 [Aaosphaeria arxii CBS 175.79]